LTKAAGVVGDLSSINDQTGGLLGKVGNRYIAGFGKEIQDYDTGEIFRKGGVLTGVTDKVKNFMGGQPISVNSVTNVFSNFGTQLSTKLLRSERR
jgi:hypothetical protein